MKHLPFVLVVAALVAACGGSESSETTGPTSGSDPDEVVVTVTSEGGFVPVEFNLERMPRYVLTSGRNLYFQGEVPAVFPGPLLPNVQVATVDDDTYAEVLELVEALGLPEIDERIDDSGAEMVADASTEVITYHDENGTHRLGFYALGMVEGTGSTDRLLAAELLQALESAAREGESTDFSPDRIQVAAGPAVRFEEAASEVEPWPLEVGYDDMDEWGAGWRCVEVSGDTVAGLWETFADATQATLWDTGSQEVSIRTLPLVPGQVACDGAPQGG